MMSNSQPDKQTEGIRLQKVLAAAGLGSRRACEDLIEAGRVSVDGKVVRGQGMRVDPQTAVVSVDGSRVNVREDLVYLALNKPQGVLSTMSDPEGRPTVGDYVADRSQRLFHVGRLDADSEGLLLLTNDGALAHKLMHPSYEVAKTYLAEVQGPLPRTVGRKLQAGVMLDDGPARVDSFRLVDTLGKVAQIEIVLHEGRKHIVRRMMDEVGHPVLRLIRTAVGPIRLGDMRPGGFRHLNAGEVAALFKTVGDGD